MKAERPSQVLSFGGGAPGVLEQMKDHPVRKLIGVSMGSMSKLTKVHHGSTVPHRGRGACKGWCAKERGKCGCWNRGVWQQLDESECG
jgi:hypothetical protein